MSRYQSSLFADKSTNRGHTIVRVVHGGDKIIISTSIGAQTIFHFWPKFSVHTDMEVPRSKSGVLCNAGPLYSFGGDGIHQALGIPNGHVAAPNVTLGVSNKRCAIGEEVPSGVGRRSVAVGECDYA